MSDGKRGKFLESMIEESNEAYKAKGWALIDKIPTPMKKVKGVAFYDKKSTVDFIGISHGRSIAFDAKQTKKRTRFPLSNVQPHQVQYLLNFQDQGGIAFFIIYFEKHNEAYLLPINQFKTWWEDAYKGGRKSIPYDWFVLNVDRIYSRNGVLLDYLYNLEPVKTVKGRVFKKPKGVGV